MQHYTKIFFSKLIYENNIHYKRVTLKTSKVIILRYYRIKYLPQTLLNGFLSWTARKQTINISKCFKASIGIFLFLKTRKFPNGHISALFPLTEYIYQKTEYNCCSSQAKNNFREISKAPFTVNISKTALNLFQ